MPKLKVDLKQRHGREEWVLTYSKTVPLVDLNAFASQLVLPGVRRNLDFSDLKEKPDVIVFTNRHGGGKVFREWYGDQLKKEKNARIVNLFGDYAEGKDLVKLPESLKAEMGPCEGRVSLSRFQSADDFMILLKSWKALAEEGQTLVLFFYNPSALGEKRAANFMQALRSLRDGDETSRQILKVISVDHSDGPFLSSLENSPYLPIARCYRLAFFSAIEIKVLAMEILKKVNIKDDLIEAIGSLTGGHPYLVQVVLNMLKERASSGSSADLDKIFRNLKKNPPDAAAFWMTDLKSILSSRPELVPSFHAYVEGETLGKSRMPPLQSERSLFLGGWLRQYEKNERWGISSQYHAFLGRQVLRELEG